MKPLPKFVLAACAILSASTVVNAGGEGWSDDFEASSKLAAAEGKDMLVDFTGSDWCGWCIKLNKEVFSHDEFKDGVKDGYVLVEIDYPKDKSKLSAETIAQNEGLKEEYAIAGYPTILLMDGKGRPFAKTGYQKGGPVSYVESLKELSAVREARDEAFEKASKLEGVAKAKMLMETLKSMGLSEALLAKFYGDEIETIKASDPSDESGYIKGIEQKGKFAEFQGKLNALASKGEFKEALALTNDTITSGGFEDGLLQQLLFLKGMIHAELGEFTKALESLDKADAAVPESPMSGQITAVKAKISNVLVLF